MRVRKKSENPKRINVLSLFDWMSCWRIALERVGIEVDNYFASEVEKFPIQIAQKNFPSTIQLWDVCWIQYEEWAIFHHQNKDPMSNGWSYITDIDLLIWWSPCQWFSRAWKQLNFNDPRSKLFFEFVRILREAKPKYFLLENVIMKKEYQDIITEHLFWINPVKINSSLVSAQNRKRLYWVWELQEDGTYRTVDVPQPNDKKIFLKDILENEVDERYYLSQKQINQLLYNWNWRWEWVKIAFKNATKKWYIEWEAGDSVDYSFPNSKTRRWRAKKRKSGTLSTQQNQSVITSDMNLRKLTPIECERLQTLPDNYTESVSNTQRYKMLGNWWTVDVIAHIFNYMFKT